MSKRPRRDSQRVLCPEEALPLHPVTFQAAALWALGGSIHPHLLLHERVNPHLILQARHEEIPIQIADTPLARALLILQECYADRAEFSSACWRLWAIGPVLEEPELAPWIRSRTEESWEIDHTIFLVAATAPAHARGDISHRGSLRAPPVHPAAVS